MIATGSSLNPDLEEDNSMNIEYQGFDENNIQHDDEVYDSFIDIEKENYDANLRKQIEVGESINEIKSKHFNPINQEMIFSSKKQRKDLPDDDPRRFEDA
jgi:hypothetical protein